MEQIESVKFLRIPLYNLYYIKDLVSYEGLTNSEIQDMFVEYSVEEIQHILQALEWGVHNPDFDFRALLSDLRYANKEIHKYICLLHAQLREWLGGEI